MNNGEHKAAHAIDPLDDLVAAQASAKPTAAPNIESIIRDEFNPLPAEQFNPAIHETDPITGGPAYNRDQSLKRKRGRKPGQQYSGGNGSPLTDNGDGTAMDEPPASAPMTAAQATAEARLASAMAFSTLQSLLGDEWSPDDDERDSVNGALAEYLRTSGGLGLPPWAGVALAFGSYAVRRTKVGEMFGLRRADTSARRLPPDAHDEPAADAGNEPSDDPAPAVLRMPATSPRPPVHSPFDPMTSREAA